MKVLLAVCGTSRSGGPGALGGGGRQFRRFAVFNALVPVDQGVSRVAEGRWPMGPIPRQKLDVYRPAEAGEELPVLVFCYGGAWNSGERGLYDFAGRAFAAAGFLTIVFDYRLVPAVRFPAFVEDTAAVIAWAVAQRGALRRRRQAACSSSAIRPGPITWRWRHSIRAIWRPRASTGRDRGRRGTGRALRFPAAGRARDACGLRPVAGPGGNPAGQRGHARGTALPADHGRCRPHRLSAQFGAPGGTARGRRVSRSS